MVVRKRTPVAHRVCRVFSMSPGGFGNDDSYGAPNDGGVEPLAAGYRTSEVLMIDSR